MREFKVDLHDTPAIPAKVAAQFLLGLKTSGRLEGARWAENLKVALDEQIPPEATPESVDASPGPDPRLAGYKRLATSILSMELCNSYFEAVRREEPGQDHYHGGRMYGLNGLVKDLMQKCIALGGTAEPLPLEQPPSVRDQSLFDDHMATWRERIKAMMVGVLQAEDAFSGLGISIRHQLEDLDRKIHSYTASKDDGMATKAAGDGAAEPLLKQNVVPSYPEQTAEETAESQQSADVAQAKAETEFLRARLQQTVQASKETEAQARHDIQTSQAQSAKQLEQVGAQLTQAAQAAETAEQELGEAKAETAQAQIAAQQSQAQALAAEENAAAQAQAKMQVSIRVQQMRQQLADLAGQNPLEEEGLGTGQVAGPGGADPIMTATQQVATQNDEPVPGEEGAAPEAPTGDPKADSEAQEAQRAGTEAEIQHQQAEQAKEQASVKQQSAVQTAGAVA